MSAENQNNATSPPKLEAIRIKEEQAEFISFDTRVQLQQKHLHTYSIPSSHSCDNGLHSGDLLQDFLKINNKYSNLVHHTPMAKHEKLRLMIEDSISQESRSCVQRIFSQIEQLKIEEKLLLYLKLPISMSNTSNTVDPLRQPLNPLGNRYEIHQTIMWIKTHLEEDPEVSLPKQEVYDEYNIFCSKNSMKPLSTADFGKVMKQVYPRVRPRRLGTRGNSRYCYAGMRKRIKLDPPILPLASGITEDEEAEYSITEEMLGAASTLIREWAESLLDTKFTTLCALGKYLVNNLCVDTRSLAAVCILSASDEAHPVTSKVINPEFPFTVSSEKIGKLREAQLQLQRKLQQRDYMRNEEYGNSDSIFQNPKKDKTVHRNREGVGEEIKRNKKGKLHVNHLAQRTNMSNKVGPLAVISTGRQKKVFKSNNQSCSISLQSNCDNLVVQSVQDEQIRIARKLVKSDSNISLQEVKSRNVRKRASVNVAAQVSELSSEKQFKLLDYDNDQGNPIHTITSDSKLSSTPNQQSTKTTVILANNQKLVKRNKTIGECTATFLNQPFESCDKESPLCSNNHFKSNGYSNGLNLTPQSGSIIINSNLSSSLAKNRLGSIDSDALNDYLNGGNNSQEQEEELLQYFQQSNSSSSDVDFNVVITETEQPMCRDKVSQLRMILQENLKDSVLPGKIRQQFIPTDKQKALQKQDTVLPTLLNQNSIVSARRRVSFETHILEQAQDNNNATSLSNNAVPQSPNTRRRIFNFTPISPGPQSPVNGRASKSSSANVSPFVSPRNTPVPRFRSNLQGICRSRSSQKGLARSISCNVPCSGIRNTTFIVPNNGSEETEHIYSPVTSVDNKTSRSQQITNIPPKLQSIPCTPFLSDITSQEPQLVINYPTQENLQEIKNVHQMHQPTDQEISDLLHSEKQFTKEQLFNRSQSVPLHRMVNPALLSPISNHQPTPTFLSHSFNPSTNSSIAPTPVPSEFNDFGSMGTCDNSSYLIDVDPLVSTDQNFLIEGKEIIPNNLNNIFDLLNEGKPEILQKHENNKVKISQTSAIVVDTVPNVNDATEFSTADSAGFLDNWTSGVNVSSSITLNSSINSISKIMHSRSHPNTPRPSLNSPFAVQYPEDSNGSRSYPTTPLHNVQQQAVYTKNNEPMLFSPIANVLNIESQNVNINNACPITAECSVTDFLDRDIPNGEATDLGSLVNFDGLQDVDTLSPLFTEVVE